MAEGWQTVASLPGLEEGELQVWRINLAEAAESPDIYRRCLTGEELDRAERLRPGQVRLQFLVGRASLRVLLGRALGVAPKDVPIILSSYGKPEASPVDGRQLHFNVAHSRETILIALCRESAVGIDLEYLDRETDVLEVARNSLTANELSEMMGIVEPEQRRAFFRCWTRKEAVVKADGRGLSLALTSFEVPVLNPAIAAPVHIFEETTDAGARPAGDYFLTDLALGEEMAGAFAVTTPDLRPSMFDFPVSLILIKAPLRLPP